MAPTFTRMDQSTAEQWAVIGKETYENPDRVADGGAQTRPPCSPRLRRPRPADSDGRMLLQDKVVIVSGVGPGLGQANARALAREGAVVVLAARNGEYLAQVQKEIEAAGGRALA